MLSQIISLRPINYTEKIIVNIVIRQCKCSWQFKYMRKIRLIGVAKLTERHVDTSIIIWSATGTARPDGDHALAGYKFLSTWNMHWYLRAGWAWLVKPVACNTARIVIKRKSKRGYTKHSDADGHDPVVSEEKSACCPTHVCLRHYSSTSERASWWSGRWGCGVKLTVIDLLVL